MNACLEIEALGSAENDLCASQYGDYLEVLRLGMSARFGQNMTVIDVLAFAGVSGHHNPLHGNEAFAARTRFKRCIVHGMLTTNLWSTLVGTRRAGPGSAYRRQDTCVLKPVHVGDTITARMTVAAIDTTQQRVELEAECRVGGVEVAVGRARLWVPCHVDHADCAAGI